MIGVDIGTTAVKVLAVSVSGKIILLESIGYPLSHPRSGIYEQDPRQIFEATLQAIQRVLATIQDTPILGLSFSSAMHSLIAVDEAGKALTPSIIWADSRSEEEAETLKNSQLGKEIYSRTGTPIHPMSPLCKLRWMQINEAALLNRTYKFVGIKEYILFHLTGEWVVDHSVASATGLFNLKERDWDHQALSWAGIRKEQLPQPVSTLQRIESKHKGLPIGLPLIVGASDGCLANIGSGGILWGDITLTIGTSGAIRELVQEPIVDPKMRLFTYILDEQHFVMGGPINNGGKVLDWYKNAFLPEVEELGAYLEEVFEQTPPGSSGLLCLPYLMGERAPFWDANTRGVFLGVRSSHTEMHFARAITEGIVFSLYQICEALQEIQGNFKTLYAGGGFARSKGWVQILADIFQRPITLSSTIQQSGKGAVVLGMKALGEISSYSDFPFERDKEKVIYPNESTFERYGVHYGVFRNLYDKLKEDFHTLIEFQQERDSTL